MDRTKKLNTFTLVDIETIFKILPRIKPNKKLYIWVETENQ